MSTPHHQPGCAKPRPAFSLVELVMVVVIIGIISAIAVPRLTNAAGNAKRSALLQDLAVIRGAIDRYYAEHGQYPGYAPATGLPSDNDFVKQMIYFSDAGGNTHEKYGYPYVYGPYVRKPFPQNPLNGLDTVKVKKLASDARPTEGSVGWVAVLTTGQFGVSASDEDLEELGVASVEAVKGNVAALTKGG